MPWHVQVAIDGHRCRYQTVPYSRVQQCSTQNAEKVGTIRANLGGTAGAAEPIPSQSRFSVLVFLFFGHCKGGAAWITNLQKTSKI